MSDKNNYYELSQFDCNTPNWRSSFDRKYDPKYYPQKCKVTKESFDPNYEEIGLSQCEIPGFRTDFDRNYLTSYLPGGLLLAGNNNK